MKNLLMALLVALSFMSCEKEEVIVDADVREATILGRWIPVGFENNLRTEFTETKRFDIYGEDGVFPTLEEFMTENPGLTGLDWEYEGDVVVVDLNFGNYSRLTPNFNCENEVVNWVNEAGEAHSTDYREGHDISECD